MDTEYLKKHLLEYTRLICGVENKHTCFCEVVKDKFVFGYELNGVQQNSRVTRQVAILLAVGFHNFEQVYMSRGFLKQNIKRKRTK